MILFIGNFNIEIALNTVGGYFFIQTFDQTILYEPFKYYKCIFN